jgi:molybdopterin synthase catalytic subunit
MSDDDRVLLARVTSDPVSVEACAGLVGSSADGAVVTFAGVVRDHDGGRGVTALEYEAHPTATEVIGAVAREVAHAHPAVSIAVEHRTGALVVGDVALACAVSSAHRAEAFAACAALVDEVKARVPIWKKQGFTDGTSEWVASLG